MKSDARTRPSFNELNALVAAWARVGDRRLRVGVVARSPGGRPVYALTLSDPRFPAEGKQHVLLSAMHAGLEHSAAATLFKLMRWLLSGDRLASEILCRQVVVCLPVPDPDGWEAERAGRDFSFARLYGRWSAAGVVEPECAPEAAALQRIIDRLQPDLYADVHGVSLAFPDQLMLESSAASPTRTTSRPYHQDIARLMDQAALGAGYPSDFQEDDREVLYWGPAVRELGARLWKGRDNWAPALYAYNRCHALTAVMEVTWPQSGLVRLQRLLRIGNERWPGELYPGYPNRVVGGCGPSGMGQTIVARGQTAVAMRRSRAELWAGHDRFASGIIDPQRIGRTAAVFTLSTAARARWLDGKDTLKAFAAGLEEHPGSDAAYVASFLDGWPAGQNRPEPYLSVSPGRNDDRAPAAGQPLRHGIAFRLRLPFRKARLKDLRLNGHPLARSAGDGYLAWRARGFTFIQVNVPPSRTRAEELYTITCDYDPVEDRSPGRWWEEAVDPFFARSESESP